MQKFGKLLCHDKENTIHLNSFEIALYKNDKEDIFYRFEDLEGNPVEGEHYIYFLMDPEYHAYKACF